MKIYRILLGLLVFLFLFASCTRMDPQRAISRGLNKTLDTKRASLDFTLSSDTFRFQLTGKSVKSKKGNGKFDGRAAIEVNDQDMNLGGSMDMRILGQELFLKLAELNFPENSPIPPDAANLLVGKWWVLPMNVETPYLKNLTEEQTALVNQFKSFTLFSNPTLVAEEPVKGAPSRKYKVDLNHEGLKEIFLALGKISGNEISEEEQKALDERLKNLEFIGHVWIAKRGGFLNRIAGDVTLKGEEPIADEGKSLTFKLDLMMWDFGKAVTIEKPEDATTFDPSLFLGLSGLGGETPELQPETPIDQPLGAEQAQ